MAKKKVSGKKKPSAKQVSNAKKLYEKLSKFLAKHK
jgi:hypothetical protein